MHMQAPTYVVSSRKTIKSCKKHKKLLLHDMNATEADAGVLNGLKCASTRTNANLHTHICRCDVFLLF